MREQWARRIAMLTGGLVAVLATVFAYTQNPPRHPPPAAAMPSAAPAPAEPRAAPGSPRLIQVGQQVYVELACARCHSIAGRGGSRGSLDGVGARLSEAEIRAWITPPAKASKPFQARHADLGLTPAQREALAAYLLSLR